MPIIKGNYKSGKLKLIIVFLLLAVFFWVLTKFSKEQTATVDARLKYDNLPEMTLLSEDNLKEFSFDMTANGFEFLLYRLKKPIISVNVSQFYNRISETATVSKSDFLKAINSQLDKNGSIINVSIEEIQVGLDVVASKKVPVITKTNIAFREGYKGNGNLKVVPDSVMVSGASIAIEEIDFIETELYSISNADKDIREEIPLIVDVHPKVSVSPNQVQVNLQVDEFTQTELSLPIEVINLPAGTTIKLIPERTQVRFDVSVDDFKGISEKDFRLVCDYSTRDKSENYLLPKLLQYPIGIINVEIEDKKIDFLIFK